MPSLEAVSRLCCHPTRRMCRRIHVPARVPRFPEALPFAIPHKSLTNVPKQMRRYGLFD